MIKRTVRLVFIISCLLLLAACNTLHGMGQDIKSLGDSIEKAADK